MDTSSSPRQVQRQISLNCLGTALYHLRRAIEHAHKAEVSFKQTTEIAMIGSRIEYIMADIRKLESD